jgi:ubiquitin
MAKNNKNSIKAFFEDIVPDEMGLVLKGRQ